ncbi:MAG: TRAP transporter small permease [Chloroflexota bacterium]
MKETENSKTPWLLKVRQNGSTWLAIASGLLILSLIVVVTYEVWMRFVLQEPTGWAVEIPRLMFLNILFLGLAYATRTGGHVSLDVVTMRLSRRPNGLLMALTSFLALGVSSVLLWQTVSILVDSYTEQWRTATVVPVVEWPFYIFMPIGSFVMCLEWLGKTIAGWQDFRRTSTAGIVENK